MRFLLIAATALLLTPHHARAQLAGFGGPVAQSDLLYLAGEPHLAYEVLAAHLAADSTDYDALWRAARARVVVGLEQVGNRAQNSWLDLAIDLAERAVALRPEGVDGLYWRGVAAGRRAMNASPGYAVELAQIVYEDAHAILAVDSLHGGAHNMLGKLNYEVMSLSRFERAVARIFMGNQALGDTSWEDARFHLEKSVQSAPDFVLFQFDLAQLYNKRGPEEAVEEAFRRVIALPPTHPIDAGLQEQVRALLAELSG
jgi:tetratricopeptide (TPR) repeat protein